MAPMPAGHAPGARATMRSMRTILHNQFLAALAMFRDCVASCPAEEGGAWDGLIAKYPFWQVAYHTLCFVDLYLERNEADFKTRPDFHPRGMAELDDEYPSRRFTRAELLAYITFCRDKLSATLGDPPTSPTAESDEVLAGPSGHARRDFSRAELHIYSMRHVQHHTGQLSAFLRRVSDGTIDPRWVGSGWK